MFCEVFLVLEGFCCCLVGFCGFLGLLDYEPVIIINRHVPLYEKASYYALAECCIVDAVRDGMNLVPYEYIVCRQGSPTMDEALDIGSESPRTSALVAPKFIV